MRVFRNSREGTGQKSPDNNQSATGAGGGQAQAGQKPGGAPGYRPEVAKSQPFHEDVIRSTYGSAAASGPPEERDDTESDTGNTLIVGPNIELKGEIAKCDTLVVQGNIQASMDSQHIEIAEGGVFVGEAAVDTAAVAGRFEGSITVRDCLTVLGTGQIDGTVRYGRLAVEDGGVIEGDVRRIDGTAARSKEDADRNAGGKAKPETGSGGEGEKAAAAGSSASSAASAVSATSDRQSEGARSSAGGQA